MGSGSRSISGVGLGLRWELVPELVDRLPAIDFLEVAPENYIGRGGYHADALEYLAPQYPLLAHGLSLSLGGTDPFDASYLRGLRDFIARVGSPWHSDHLSFGTSDGRALHDLLPIAFTRAGVRRLVSRIQGARDAIGVPLAVENISFYLPPDPGEMPEAEFIAEVCDRADCGLLLDVNNLFVNATNFGFDPTEWLDTVPLHRVVQLHVAGHEWFDESLTPTTAEAPGALIVDTHGADVPGPVFGLLADVLARTGPVPIVLERDHRIPSLETLLAEVDAVKRIVASAGAPEKGTCPAELCEPCSERGRVHRVSPRSL
jgi:uncharacterized protein